MQRYKFQARLDRWPYQVTIPPLYESGEYRIEAIGSFVNPTTGQHYNLSTRKLLTVVSNYGIGNVDDITPSENWETLFGSYLNTGDNNLDGSSDVLDIVSVISYILSTPSGETNNYASIEINTLIDEYNLDVDPDTVFEAVMDINNSGTVDVQDIVLIVNGILS